MIAQHAFTNPHKIPARTLPQVASVECSCGTVHQSPDGRVPAGWTVSRGQAFCADCTRIGIPARLITAPAPKPRPARAIDPRPTDQSICLPRKVIDLLVEGQALMPVASKKRSDWVARANAMLEAVSQAAA